MRFQVSEMMDLNTETQVIIYHVRPGGPNQNGQGECH